MFSQLLLAPVAVAHHMTLYVVSTSGGKENCLFPDYYFLCMQMRDGFLQGMAGRQEMKRE